MKPYGFKSTVKNVQSKKGQKRQLKEIGFGRFNERQTVKTELRTITVDGVIEDADDLEALDNV